MCSKILPKIGIEASKSSTIEESLNYFNCFNILRNAFSALNINIVEFYKRNGPQVECTLTVTKQGQTWILAKGESETKEEAKCRAAQTALIVFLANNHPVRKNNSGNYSTGGNRHREKISLTTSLPDYMNEVKINIRSVVNGIIDSGKLIKDLTSLSSSLEEKVSIKNSDSSSANSNPNQINLVSTAMENEGSICLSSSSADEMTRKRSCSEGGGGGERVEAHYSMCEMKKALTPIAIEEIVQKWYCFIPLRNAFKALNVNVVEFYIRKGENVECTLTVTKDGQTWILGKGEGVGKKKARTSAASIAIKTFLERKFPVKKRKLLGSHSTMMSKGQRRSYERSIPVPEFLHEARKNIFLMTKNAYKDLLFPKSYVKGKGMENFDDSAADEQEPSASKDNGSTVSASASASASPLDHMNSISTSAIDQNAAVTSPFSVVEERILNSVFPPVDLEDTNTLLGIDTKSKSLVETVDEKSTAMVEKVYKESSSVIEKVYNEFLSVVERVDINSSSAVEKTENESTCVGEKTDHKSSVVEKTDNKSTSVVEKTENESTSVVEKTENESTSVVEMVLSPSVIENVLEKWNFLCLMQLRNAFKKCSVNVIEFYMRNKKYIECSLTVTKDGETWTLGKGEGETKEKARCNAAKSAIKLFLENRAPVAKSDKQKRKPRKYRSLPDYMNKVRLDIFALAKPIIFIEIQRQNSPSLDSTNICSASLDTKILDSKKQNSTSLNSMEMTMECDLRNSELETMMKNDNRDRETDCDEIFKGLSDDEGEGLVMSVVSALVSSFERYEKNDDCDFDLNGTLHSQSNVEESDQLRTDFRGKCHIKSTLDDTRQSQLDLEKSQPQETLSNSIQYIMSVFSDVPEMQPDIEPVNQLRAEEMVANHLLLNLRDESQVMQSTALVEKGNKEDDLKDASQSRKELAETIKSETTLSEKNQSHPRSDDLIKISQLFTDVKLTFKLQTDPIDLSQLKIDQKEMSQLQTDPKEMSQLQTDPKEMSQLQTDPKEISQLQTDPKEMSQLQIDPKEMSQPPKDSKDLSQLQKDPRETSLLKIDVEDTDSNDANELIKYSTDNCEHRESYQSTASSNHVQADSQECSPQQQTDSDESSHSEPDSKRDSLGMLQENESRIEKLCSNFSELKSDVILLNKIYHKFQNSYNFLVDSFNHSKLNYEFVTRKNPTFESTLIIRLREDEDMILGKEKGSTDFKSLKKLSTKVLENLLKNCHTILVKKEVVFEGVISLSDLITSKKKHHETDPQISDDLNEDVDVEALSHLSSQAVAETKENETNSTERPPSSNGLVVGIDRNEEEEEEEDETMLRFKTKIEKLFDKMIQKIHSQEIVPDLVFDPQLSQQQIEFIHLIIKEKEKYNILQSKLLEVDSNSCIVVSEVLNSQSLFKRISSLGKNTEKFAIYSPGSLTIDAIRNFKMLP